MSEIFGGAEGKEIKVMSKFDAEFATLYENHEHIKNWFLGGIFLGINIKQVEKETKKYAYIYDLLDKKIKIINVPFIVGKIIYGIKTEQLNQFGGLFIKYMGKKISPKDPTHKFNDYDLKIYESEKIKDKWENKELMKNINDESILEDWKKAIEDLKSETKDDVPF